MNPLDHGVGLEEHEPSRHAEVEHGAVVAGRNHDRVVGGERGEKAGDEFEFVHWTNHFGFQSAGATMM